MKEIQASVTLARPGGSKKADFCVTNFMNGPYLRNESTDFANFRFLLLKILSMMKWIPPFSPSSIFRMPQTGTYFVRG